jgi:putative heme-binding domain-containing protein
MRAFIILLFCQSLAVAAPLKALIIDGENRHHEWKKTSPAITDILTASGRFTVNVATTPQGQVSDEDWAAFKPDFAAYDVLVLNYWGRAWAPATVAAFESYVAQGGGVVFVHSAVAGFEQSPAVTRMIGLGWRGSTAAGRCLFVDDSGKTCYHAKGEGGKVGHSQRHEFHIDARQADHPILRGLRNPWSHATDELYHRLRGPAEDLSLLATAKSPVTKVHEPMMWTVTHGKGRSFVPVLGHDVIAMSSEGFGLTLARGAEWAATGAVTIPAPAVSRAVIEAHIDPAVEVFGPYAAVKLPITHGVKLWNPTVVETAPDGRIFAANYTGEVYTLRDSDGDGLEDTATLFCNVTDDKLRYPTGLAIKDGEVYVGTTQEVRVYTDTDGDGVADKSRTFFKDFPWTLHYFDWTFALTFGPDEHLYLILCTDYLNGGRAPDPKGYRGAILRISPDGKSVERYATGLRFAYGLAFNQHGDLFFSDNKGGGNPDEEFNHVVRGGFYGHNPAKYPGHGPPIDPLVKIQHGFGSGGLCANSADNDFGAAAGDIFFACWGPDGRWDRGSIVRIKLSKQADGSYKAAEFPVAKPLAKVIDLAFGQDGSLYAARFGRENRGHTPYKEPDGDIYRFFHAPWLKASAKQELVARVKGDVARGEKLFTERACATCHSLDGTTELLGPNLKGIGDMFSRSEMLAALNEPAAGIKSGHETTSITRKDGSVLMGRMVTTDESATTLMIPGNQAITIPQADIAKSETLDTSLMPAGLVSSYRWEIAEGRVSLHQDDTDINDLFAFLEVREDATETPFPSAANLARLDFKQPTTFNALSITGFRHHKYAPKTFQLICDGKPAYTVKNASYTDNHFRARFDSVTCKSAELVITDRYGPSPAIRELGLYNLDSASSEVWSFNYGPDAIKPHFHPLAHPLVGDSLADFRPKDHVLHRGLWFCWKTINGVNYWEENKQTQRSAGLTEVTSTSVDTRPDMSAEISMQLAYHPPDAPTVVSESRRIQISAPDAAGNYRIDWDMTFTAEQDASFDVTPPPSRGGPGWGGYGGLSFRGAADWQQVVYASSAAGILADSAKPQVGPKADWYSIARDRGVRSDSVTIFDHPENPRAPTPWYVYGGHFRFLNPSPLYNGAISLKKGETLRLRYRVLVHKGLPEVELLKAEYAGGKWGL